MNYDFSPSPINRLKIEYLKDLKEDNGRLVRKIWAESLPPGMKKRKMKKLESLLTKFDEMTGTLGPLGRGRDLKEEVRSYRIQLGILKKIQKIRKQGEFLRKRICHVFSSE